LATSWLVRGGQTGQGAKNSQKSGQSCFLLAAAKYRKGCPGEIARRAGSSAGGWNKMERFGTLKKDVSRGGCPKLDATDKTQLDRINRIDWMKDKLGFSSC
jgi:hypothetical protein